MLTNLSSLTNLNRRKNFNFFIKCLQPAKINKNKCRYKIKKMSEFFKTNQKKLGDWAGGQFIVARSIAEPVGAGTFLVEAGAGVKM